MSSLRLTGGAELFIDIDVQRGEGCVHLTDDLLHIHEVFVVITPLSERLVINKVTLRRSRLAVDGVGAPVAALQIEDGLAKITTHLLTLFGGTLLTDMVDTRDLTVWIVDMVLVREDHLEFSDQCRLRQGQDLEQESVRELLLIVSRDGGGTHGFDAKIFLVLREEPA